VKRATLSVLVAAMALAAFSTASLAASNRVPQVPVTGGGLQAYLNSKDGGITVLGDQLDVQTWKTTVSGNSAATLQISLGGASGNEIGLYEAHSHTTRVPIFQKEAPAGWFAVVSFRTSVPELVINVFDGLGQHQSRTPIDNFETENFGYYIKNIGGDIGHTEDTHNTLGKAAALTFAGTGDNSGCWWLCFDQDRAASGDEGADFDDAVLFLESVNPTPVSKATWASVKARFR
jgi:hypothetical protein